MNRNEFYDNLNKYRANSLTHYGTLGQKWGVRKWQNYDGTFNEAGKKRYFGTGKFEPVSKDEQGDKINSKVNEIYKNYKPNDYNRALNQSDLSNDEWWKLKKELNKKLYTEDEKYSKIVNDENVKNALQEYLNTIDDTHKEEQRIYSEEFRKSNPKAENFDGDGTEFWYKFANKDIVDKGDKAYWNLREAVSKNSFKNGKWDYEMLDKVMSDINEIVEKEQDLDKIYNALKENTDVDFRNNEEKIGSSWKSMSDQDYAQVEKEMKKSGWDTNKELKPGNQVYSKPIDNDDYKGIKYEVDAYKFHDNSVDDINKKYQEHINFLNKKDSLKQVLDNFADYEYPYYEKYINNHNKYFDNKLDAISKAEFINAVKSNINLNRTGLSWNDELYMQFVPKENKDFNYFKDMYDVFTVDVDPKSGKISNFTII